MRITRLDLSFAADVGLKPKLMEPLDQVVVLTGANGAGKSRLLREIWTALSSNILDTIGLRNSQAILSAHDNFVRLGKPSDYGEDLVRQCRRALDLEACFTLDQGFKNNFVFKFLPSKPTLADHRSKSESQWEGEEGSVKNHRDLGALAEFASSVVVRVARRALHATHADIDSGPAEKDAAVRAKERLFDLIEALLGERPTLDINWQPNLFGRPIPDAQLSDGQSFLFQMAVALYAHGASSNTKITSEYQEKTLDGMILLLDEPEQHLHPAALVEMVERLRQANPSGQIWIATHSVPLLAALPTESIWYMREGEVSWAGRNPEIVLDGLLGGPDGRDQMEDFLRLPAQFASHRFAAECLIPPKAVSTGPEDPQSAQVIGLCQSVANSVGTPMRILDFGAGQGRLLSALQERWSGEGEFPISVDYLAFEQFPDGRGFLARNVERAYGVGSATTRVLQKTDQLALLDNGSVDVVVMCNVLHEIPPEQWKQILGAGGPITRLLKASGKLLILEDMEIPHGEKAHRCGFLMLDHQHLFKLMSCTEADKEKIVTLEDRNGRLKAHRIDAALVGRTTSDSTTSALQLLKETALREIQSIRGQAAGARNGRLHALWTQLFANAELAIQG